MATEKRTLRIILWDQLSDQISSLSDANWKHDHFLFLETLKEATYVNHHVKKLAFLFSAMRHFAKKIQKKGAKVTYIKISQKVPSLTDGVALVLEKNHATQIVITEPGEFRILQEIKAWGKKFKIDLEIREDSRFLISHKNFRSWSKNKKKLLLEHFYEMMRKKTGFLLDHEGKPFGGKWNFDKENRSPMKEQIRLPHPYKVQPDEITKNVLKEIKKHFPHQFGDLNNFWFAVTQDEAKEAFDHFVQHCLPHFGKYQDAMLSEEPLLYHSVISHYLNAGLLDAQQICQTVHDAYVKKKVSIENAEGFLRQVLGWREYIRGIYWLKMPKYARMNFLNAKQKLPWFYWTGKTEMNCLRHCIEQTIKHAYSHHIQRLMITGNFAMLIGVAPKEVCFWYLSVYADAHEWVELPNTLGMSQFADGGILATKPYCSSGSYIDKMSNFCKTCSYNVKVKTGKNACPFNYLYWNFLLQNQKKLKKNPRLSLAYRQLSRFSLSKKKIIQNESKNFIKKLSSKKNNR